MAEEDTPLYVRLSQEPNRRLEQAVLLSGRSKRRIIEDAVRDHLSDEGLVVGRVALRANEPAEVLTLAEAAAFLRLDIAELRAAAETNTVPGRLIAGSWRFSRPAILAWLGEETQNAAEASANRAG